MLRSRHCGFVSRAELHHCTQCHAELHPDRTDSDDLGSWDALVPADPPSDDVPSYVDIARFGNAADAGYFAEEIAARLDVEPLLEWREQRDPLHGHWAPSFVLRVAEDDAEETAELLQSLAASSTSPDEFAHPFDERPDYSHYTPEEWAAVDDAASGSGINWVPIVFTLAVGGLIIWSARRGHPAPPPRAELPNAAGPTDVWHALDTTAGDWVQQIDDIGGTRVLTIDPQNRRALLREDLNGDGFFESHSEYDLPRF